MPFIDSDDPIGIGVAIIGLDVLVVVALSVIIRHRLGDARWRVLHRLAYAAFMLIVAHVLMSGTDVMPVWVSLVVVSAWLVTVIAWLAATSTLDGATRWLAELMPRRRYIGDLAVRVDARLCTRYGVCEQVAPRVFQLRGEGQLSYRPAVPFAQSDAVRLAIEMCPTRAITLVEKSTDRSYLSGQP